MKIELINNRSNTNLGIQVQQHSKNCQRFDIASAFITEDALTILDSFVKKNKNKFRTGRIITGLYHCFNSKKVLLELQRLSLISKGMLQVKISRTEKFHWKYYHFYYPQQEILYIGSANFTKAGMYEMGELQTKLTISKKDKALSKESADNFSHEWENAEDIQNIPLEKYKQIVLPKSFEGGLDPAIKKILFSPISQAVHGMPTSFRIARTSGNVSSITQKKISETQSHWDKSGWYYFTCINKKQFDLYLNGSPLFMVHKIGNSYEFEIVLIKDKSVVKTPDGNYFIAYKNISRTRKETLKMINLLGEIGIVYRVRKEIDRKLTKRQTKTIMDFFGIK